MIEDCNGCNSNPTSGCSENTSAADLIIAKNKLAILLPNLLSAITNLHNAIDACCLTTNGNLDLIDNRLDTIIQNNEDCCNEVNSRLITIGNLLGQLQDGVQPVCSTTTTVPVTTTTTTAGITTTTTTISGTTTTTTTCLDCTTTTTTAGAETTTTTAALFSYEVRLSDSLISICGEDIVNVYSETPFGTGTTLYADPGLHIPVATFDYVIVVDTANIYNINDTTGTIETDTGEICPV